MMVIVNTVATGRSCRLWYEFDFFVIANVSALILVILESIPREMLLELLVMGLDSVVTTGFMVAAYPLIS